MQSLWRQACAFEEVKDDVAFMTTRRDKHWFCSQYCGGLGRDRDAADSVWDLLTTMNAPHDLLALVACVPTLRDRFFKSAIHFVETNGSSVEEEGSYQPASAGITKHMVTHARAETTECFREFLLEMIQTGLSLETTRTTAVRKAQLVMLTDPGQDLDDEMTMVLLRSLNDKGVVECKGAVATLAPARARARLTRGTLDELGLEYVPVATGSDGGFTKHTATFEKTSSSYIAPDDDTFTGLTGQELLLQIYTAATPASIELLVIASMKDAAEFMRANEGLFAEKTRSVTIMGGVMPFDEDDDDDGTLLLPDTVCSLHSPYLATPPLPP